MEMFTKLFLKEHHSKFKCRVGNLFKKPFFLSCWSSVYGVGHKIFVLTSPSHLALADITHQLMLSILTDIKSPTTATSDSHLLFLLNQNNELYDTFTPQL